MSRVHPLCCALAVALAWLCPSLSARAQTEDAQSDARRLYREGVEHVAKAEWARALDMFERSAALRPHATTSYNIGACQRAMGRYTRARVSFREALARNADNAGELGQSLADDTHTYLAEIDRLLSRVELRIRPADGRIAVDGAPLARDRESEPPRFVAGVRGGGAGEPLPGKSFVLELDPGAHVLSFAREGYRDVVVNRTWASGENEAFVLELDRLPAMVRISADTDRAVVEVDDQMLGFAPITVERPAGDHRVVVRQDGYEPYESMVHVKAGDDVTLRATMVEETPNVLESWWFWTGAGVAVSATVVVTYFATRPDPERPAPNGGGLGWVVPLE